jgi:hypothetical protein
LLLTLSTTAPPSAHAQTVISYRVEAALPDVETLGGTTVRPSDVIDLDSAALIFDAFGTNPFAEDLDAVHIKQDGNVIFSTDSDVTQAFPGLPDGFKNGDLVEWNGSTGSLFFEESRFSGGGDPNISAFHLFESGPNAGKLLLGTKGTNDVLGGMSFEWGNLLLYDAGADTSSIFFDQDLIGGALSQRTIDAVHVLSSGNLLLSTLIDNGVLGGVQLKAKDLVEFDPETGTTGFPAFLDGSGLFDGATRNIDAAFVPEPGTGLLVGLGLAVFATRRRRHRAG